LESTPNLAFRRNLEPIEDERSLGLWTVSGFVDLVSERRYLLHRARASELSRLGAGVVAFRLASAHALAPHACPGVVDIVHRDSRLELLTEYHLHLAPSTRSEEELRRLFAALIEVVAEFEHHRFCCAGLGPETLAVADDGSLRVLPPAYALPRTTEEALGEDGGSVCAVDDFAATRRRHLERIAFTARGIAAQARGGAARGAFAEALVEAADAIDGGRIRSLDELSRSLFGGGVDTTSTLPETDETPDAAPDVGEATIVEIRGGPGTGKTRTLRALRAAYAERDMGACMVDTWSFADRPRRKSATKETPSGCSIWMVDDIDEQRFIHANLLEHVSDRAEDHGVLVYTVDPDRITDELSAFLQSLRTHAGGEFRTVQTERAGRAAHGADAIEPLLESLSAEERQVVELLCVAQFALPCDLVLSVFSGGGSEIHRSLHRLASLDLVEIEYRPVPPGGHTSITVGMSSASLRHAVRDALPCDRRRNLHRTVARLAEGHPSFPAMCVYTHLMDGEEPAAAAGYALSFMKDSAREQRAPFLDELIAHFADDEAVEGVPYGDRLFAMYTLGSDLFASGRRADAEKLLLHAHSLAEDSEEVRLNAALVGDVARLLADTWAARGNYTAALDLLFDTKDSLSAYLSLAEQARLMNEIGWLQYRLGDYENSVESCKLSLNTLNPGDHPVVVAQALNLMGVIHFNTSRYDEAISYYEQGAFLREKEGAQDALAGSYNNLALAYQAKGEYDKALAYYAKSFDIKRQVNNETGLAAGYLNQALLYLEIHNFEEAERKCRESLEISTNLGLAQLTAETHSTLGDIEEMRGHHDEAEAYYLKAVEFASSLETINEEMGARRRLAKLYLTRDRLAEAREQIEAAQRLGAQIGSKYESAQIEGILGDLCVAEGEHMAAVEHYEKAANAYATVSKYRHAATALANIGLAHTECGNTFEAKHYLDRSLDLIKSEIGHEIPEEIVALQQVLRERPVRTSLAATESQKLLYAFYELSSLAEFADDKTSFFKRAIAVLQDLTGAHSCVLALQAPDGSFVAVREGGEQEPIVDPGLRALLARSLQLGALLHSESPEVGDIAAQVKLPGEARESLGGSSAGGFICVPMKSMGNNLGCALLHVSKAALPPSTEDTNFITSVGRHIAGDLRLTFHLEEHANKEKTLETEFETLKAQVVDRYRFDNLIGKDESMKKVFRTIEKVKDMDTGILLIGESGTGKTEMARTIHYNSPRRKRPFQEIHCAEIPANLIESELFGHEKGSFTGAVQRKLGRCEVADGGTVFLDDVNVVPGDIQAKLLHYLESKSFIRLGGTQTISTDVRIIASSNEDLEQLVKTGRFREDLYYRLKVIQIELPPLRERRDDMIEIAQEFLKKRCSAQNKPLKTLSSETIKLFQRYPWPGNVRELQNVLEQIVLLSDDDIVEPASLPEDFLKRATGSTRHGRQTLQALVRQLVELESYSEANPLMPQIEAMVAHEMADHIDNKARAASMLGITKPTLYNRLRGFDKMN
jgi:DNA-binding NtrC family response regulator/tetratricopeptide (TPR) repeat protein